MSEIAMATRPETVGMSGERLGRIDAWMARYVEAGKLPWAMTVITRHGETAYSRCIGKADIATGRAIEDDAILRIYSMSKPITAVAILMLYEEGLLQLDDPVSRFIPEFADTPVVAGDHGAELVTEPLRHPITVRHLLTHTSGLIYGAFGGGTLERLYDENATDFGPQDGTLEAVCKRLAALPLDHQPGARWTYGVSIDVLGRIVEVISGQSFDRFLQQRIFAPLAMRDTFFELPPDRMDRFVPCYERGPDDGLLSYDGVEDSVHAAGVTCFSGGGGLLSTARDYQRFAEMLRGGGALGDVRILGPRTVSFMASNHMPGGVDLAAMGQPVFSETSYEGIGFGLGVSVVLDPAHAQVLTSKGEYAWGGMASTAFWIDPEQDMSVLFLTQLVPSSSYPIRRELRVLASQAIVA
jgi:CubicO group peptidase (beta-lactamase class C family)